MRMSIDPLILPQGAIYADFWSKKCFFFSFARATWEFRELEFMLFDSPKDIIFEELIS